MSQSFVDKWCWLLGDEVFQHSNFWRAERGEGPLEVPGWRTTGGRLVEELA